jgi:hypothetical protein
MYTLCNRTTMRQSRAVFVKHILQNVLMYKQGFSTYLIALRGNISDNEGRRADQIYGGGPLLGCLGCRVLNSAKRSKGKERKRKGKGGKEGKREGKKSPWEVLESTLKMEKAIKE